MTDTKQGDVLSLVDNEKLGIVYILNNTFLNSKQIRRRGF